MQHPPFFFAQSVSVFPRPREKVAFLSCILIYMFFDELRKFNFGTHFAVSGGPLKDFHSDKQ